MTFHLFQIVSTRLCKQRKLLVMAAVHLRSNPLNIQVNVEPFEKLTVVVSHC